MLIRIVRHSQKILLCRRGTVAIQVGILMTVFIGMAGLGAEIPYVIYKNRQMQNAADAAALGGAMASMQGYPAIAVEAKAIAAALGFVDGAGGVTVTVNNPPKSGSHTANASAVEVIVSQPQTLKLGAAFLSSPLNVNARAVALPGSNPTPAILVMDPNSATGLSVSNGAAVTLAGPVEVNSTGSKALSVTGAGSLTANKLYVSGQAYQGQGGQINVNPADEYQDHASSLDPYANVSVPASSGCDHTNFSLGWASSTQQMQPGRYCNGVSIGNGAIVSMAAGIYYIESGTFNVGGGTTLTGSGVTIVLTQNTSGYATVSIGNGASVTLSAPTSGDLAGLLFFADRNAPNSGVNTFAGGASVILTGALYFPTQQLVFSNGAGTQACTQVIAWQIQFTGGTASAFSSNCDNTGVRSFSSGILLVE